MADKLREFDRDALKTHLRTMVDTHRDAMKATAASYFGGGAAARGRLSTRVLASNILDRFIHYQHATGIKPTRENVYDYLRHLYGNAIDPATLAQLTGYQPPTTPASSVTPPQAASTQTVQPTSNSQAPPVAPAAATPQTSTAPAPPKQRYTAGGHPILSAADYQKLVRQSGGNPNNISRAAMKTIPPDAPVVGESVRRRRHPLQEASNADILKRSELDRIFVAIAQQLTINKLTQNSGNTAPPPSTTNASRQQQPPVQNLQAAMSDIVDMQKFVQAMRDSEDQKQTDAILAAFKQFTGGVAPLKDLLARVARDTQNAFPADGSTLRPNVIDSLLKAKRS